MKTGIETFLILALATTILCGPVLDNFPITFEMTGQTTYTPDSGGISRTGYQLRLGFSYYQWLGVEIITGTSKNDVLIVELDDFYTTSENPLRTGHEVSVQDYYRTGNALNYDQNTDYDISTFNYVTKKDYFIDLIRYVGSNSNQDWNGAANKYSLTQVCFYTSKNLFSLSTWKDGLSQCYYFEIDAYFSTFKGVELKNFELNGYATGIYGWIDGPYVSDNLYLYHRVPLYAYTEEPAMAIEIGTTKGNVGQDYNVFSPIESETGDYYGSSITNITKDNTRTGGYENGGLTLQSWNANPAFPIAEHSYTTVRATFSRYINTHDSYDRVLQSTFIFCIYFYAQGTIVSQLTSQACEVVELSPHYPQQKLPVKSGFYLLICWSLFLVMLISAQ